MGTYKVPQNVEADDKILGPLSMKQFIYALIGLGYGALTFAIFKAFLIIWVIIGVPPMLFLLGLGLYQREDQPMETFIVAVAQYFTRPRTRLWQKEPIADAFRLEPPPPKPEMAVRDSRDVRSQLQQLAELVDTRGWSVKEPELQEPEEMPVVDLDDRIGGATLAPVPVIADEGSVTASDDMLDTTTEAAQNLNVLIENSVKSIREEAVTKMRERALTTPKPQAIAQTPAASPKPATLHDPAAAEAARRAIAAASVSEMTPSPSDDIVKLATEGGDLTVTQIAAQARKTMQPLAEGQTVNVRHAEPATI